MQETIWVMDIEASGLSPVSYPIEVAMVNGDREYQALILPADNWTHWSPKAETLHGISRQELCHRGEPVERVARELNQLLGRETVFSDHSDWDGFWLRQLFAAAGIKQSFTVMDITILLDSGQMDLFVHTLETLCQSRSHRAHRALNDARVIHQAVVGAGAKGA